MLRMSAYNSETLQLLTQIAGILNNQPRGVSVSNADFIPIKRCPECGTSKPLSCFYKNRAIASGVSAHCKDCTKARVKSWREQNPERKAAAAKLWYNENKGAISEARVARYWADPYKYRAMTREYVASLPMDRRAAMDARVKDWNRKNPERYQTIQRAGKARRRSREARASGKHTAADIRALLDLQRGSCAVCKCNLPKGYHVDHVIPLSKGGGNDRMNLQLLCRHCNVTKNARDPLEFMQSRGFLL